MDLYTFLCFLSMSLTCGLISYDSSKERCFKEYMDSEREKEKEYFTSKSKLISMILSYELSDYIPKPTTIRHLCPPEVSKKIKKAICKHNKNPELESLLEILLDYIPVEYLGNLMRNIKTLKISHKDYINRSVVSKSLGSYSRENNTIYLTQKNFDILSHEFLHAASSFDNDDVSFSGFTYENEYVKFFYGLNEGYTEVLNVRLFSSKIRGYNSCYKICLLIELLFDNYHDMEHAYFCNNTDLLIETFLKYGTKEEFVYIVECLDVFAKTAPEKQEVNDVINLLKDIISRTNNPDKIMRCEELTKEDLKEKSFVKKLVRKRD